MLIMDAPHVCSDLWEVWQIIGYVLLVFKIVIPIIIIIFGAIDLGKAVVASKDDEIKKSVKSLAIRAVAGVIIFFVPTLVGLVFKMVGSFKDVKTEFDACSLCITKPGSCSEASTKCVEQGKTWNKSANTCE